MSFAIEAGRGRIILNPHANQCSIAIDVNGAGYSLMLSPDQLNELADAARKMAWGINSRQEKGEFI